MKTYYWTTNSDGLAVLHEDLQEPITYTKDSIEFSISNIKKGRSAYATYEAYESHLNMMQEGLYYAKK